MRTAFYKSFERDLKKLKKNRQMLGRIQDAIEEVEEAKDLRDLPRLKKLSGGSEDYYRIRVGDYRIGIALEEGTVAFVRCLHRKDIYRYLKTSTAIFRERSHPRRMRRITQHCT